MAYEQINIRVPSEMFRQVKESGIKYRKLIELGLKYLNERTELQQELTELRAGNEKLQSVVSRQGGRILELERKKEGEEQ